MNSQQYSSPENFTDTRYLAYRFYTETIEVSRMSALAFFEAGEQQFKGKRMFWQNREKTFTWVGLGHAHVISAHSPHGRFEQIKEEWQSLCKQIVNEEREVQPILFGGFSFDPLNEKDSVWTKFPEAYFAVPTFQMIIKGERAYVSIHLITKDKDTFTAFDALRKERDRLIHSAQVSELKKYRKPLVVKRTELKKDEYLDSIKKVTAVIKAKQAEKVVIARALKLNFDQPLAPASALSQVSEEQPESFLFGMEAENQFFFGATPERLVKVEDRQALSTCLAGSTPRGKTVEIDAALGNELLNDKKNRSEHQFVVKMISQVFDAHSSKMFVPKTPKLMKIRDIQHLYTPVEGELKDGSNLLDLVRDLHPTPALGGEPKQEAMSLIRQYETMNRGYYAAPVGWIDAKGDGEFAVAIRSALLDGKDAYLYAGGGIVEDSHPEAEYDETWVKFRPMLRVLGGQMSDES
ncbi:Salicylate biosynthesis isochorismate synthase [Planococcus massiliensis]|uniref:isochorismate synthase n=1 Tax=Planococcus massiliensis TaxID=1499687 RepID=A0A098ENH6_9BACL|nr:isochorismate synthase [Planococcus massiliensis]CEG23337.1 Salicylate biosynthesis isochorismate synthase [Planococcus massiliensis]